MSKVAMNLVKAMEELAPGIFRMTLESEHIAVNALPGQFVNVKCCDGSNTLLRRPISICSVNREENSYDIVFQIKGTGTELLANKQPGDEIDVMGPLGKPFETGAQYKRIAVVGGGIGIFPLLFLLRESKAEVKHSYLGFRCSDLIVLREEFDEASDMSLIATDDCSEGYGGLVTEPLEKDIASAGYDLIYTCGPTPMIRKVAEISEKSSIPCQVSLEQRMGCGFGACLVCACKIGRGEEWQYKHVCKDGPVFWSTDVNFEV